MPITGDGNPTPADATGEEDMQLDGTAEERVATKFKPGMKFRLTA